LCSWVCSWARQGQPQARAVEGTKVSRHRRLVPSHLSEFLDSLFWLDILSYIVLNRYCQNDIFITLTISITREIKARQFDLDITKASTTSQYQLSRSNNSHHDAFHPLRIHLQGVPHCQPSPPPISHHQRRLPLRFHPRSLEPNRKL